MSKYTLGRVCSGFADSESTQAESVAESVTHINKIQIQNRKAEI